MNSKSDFQCKRHGNVKPENLRGHLDKRCNKIRYRCKFCEHDYQNKRHSHLFKEREKAQLKVLEDANLAGLFRPSRLVRGQQVQIKIAKLLSKLGDIKHD